MKLKLLRSVFLAASVCVASLTVSAAPLKRADVVADPAWVLHLDFDALRPTTIGQYILAEMDKPEAKARLAIFQSIFSFDLRTQLHGATLYGATTKPEDGVLIVYADFDADKLLTLAKAAHDYQTSEDGKHTIHSWIDDNKKHKDDEPRRTYAAIQGKRVIFAQRESSVAMALHVLDGANPNLSSGKAFAHLGEPGSGHVVEAAARKMDISDSDPNAAMLKLAKGVELAVGEKDKQLEGHLTLVADDEKVAGHIFSIAQGILALMKLDSSKPETVKFADAFAITQDGANVVGKITLPASDVVEMIKTGAAKKAQEKKHSDE